MFKVILGNTNKNPNGLEGFDMEAALKKIPTKDLAIMTFKQMNDHVTSCARNSESTLRVLKLVGYIVGALAIEKINEMFHFVQHLPTLPGG